MLPLIALLILLGGAAAILAWLHFRPAPPTTAWPQTPSAVTSDGQMVYKADRTITYEELGKMSRHEGDAWTAMAMQEVAAELGQRAPADFVVDVQVWAQDEHQRMAVIGTATLDPDWNNTDGTDDDHA